MSWYWYVAGAILVFDLCFLAYTLLLARRRIASDLLTYEPLEWPERQRRETNRRSQPAAVTQQGPIRTTLEYPETAPVRASRL